jgi:hypothetical protein
MKYLVFIAVLCMSSQLFGQDQTKGFQGHWTEREQANVLLVPYEHRMFLSDVNREIGNQTGLDIFEIQRIFREGTNQMIANAGSESYRFIDMLNEDIDFVYNSIQWTYTQVPPPPTEKTKARKWLDKVTEKREPEQKGDGVNIEEGELQTYYDEKERFMDIVVKNDDLIPHLVEAYDCDYMIFVNELDIKVLRDFNRDNGQAWGRMVKIHYSILDREGEKVYASAAYFEYSPEEKEIWSLIRKNLEQPAKQIVSHLPQAEQTAGASFMTRSTNSK